MTDNSDKNKQKNVFSSSSSDSEDASFESATNEVWKKRKDEQDKLNDSKKLKFMEQKKRFYFKSTRVQIDPTIKSTAAQFRKQTTLEASVAKMPVGHHEEEYYSENEGGNTPFKTVNPPPQDVSTEEGLKCPEIFKSPPKNCKKGTTNKIHILGPAKSTTTTSAKTSTIKTGVEMKTTGTQTYDHYFEARMTATEGEEDRKAPIGSIVSANAAEINCVLWPNMAKAPTIYGLVLNQHHHDERAAEECESNQTFVEFVVRGETKWVDKTKNHVIKCAIDTERLTICAMPPTTMKKERRSVKREYLQWFEKHEKGEELSWKLKKIEGGCRACGSPDCTYMKHRSKIDTLISNLRALDDLAPEERRHMAYTMAIEIAHGKCGFRNRKRLGWCVETLTRNTFPSESYTGFRNIGEGEDSSTSSSEESSVVLLSD